MKPAFLAALLLALPFAAHAEGKYDCAEQVKAFAKANLDVKAKAKNVAESMIVSDAEYKGEQEVGAKNKKQTVGIYFTIGAIEKSLHMVIVALDQACDPKIIQFAELADKVE